MLQYKVKSLKNPNTRQPLDITIAVFRIIIKVYNQTHDARHYCWPLNDRGLICMGPLIFGFFLKINVYYGFFLKGSIYLRWLRFSPDFWVYKTWDVELKNSSICWIPHLLMQVIWYYDYSFLLLYLNHSLLVKIKTNRFQNILLERLSVNVLN